MGKEVGRKVLVKIGDGEMSEAFSTLAAKFRESMSSRALRISPWRLASSL